MDTTWSSNDNMDSLFEDSHILLDWCTTDTDMSLDLHILANGVNNVRALFRQLTSWCNDNSLYLIWGSIDWLQASNGESTCFTSTRLGLSNCVLSLYDRHNALLLDSWRLFESVSVDASQNFFFESHLIEFGNYFVPVCFKCFFFFLFFNILLFFLFVVDLFCFFFGLIFGLGVCFSWFNHVRLFFVLKNNDKTFQATRLLYWTNQLIDVINKFLTN